MRRTHSPNRVQILPYSGEDLCPETATRTRFVPLRRTRAGLRGPLDDGDDGGAATTIANLSVPSGCAGSIRTRERSDMTDGTKYQSLTDDQIRSQFRLTEDVVRQAVALGRSIAERADRSDEVDGPVALSSDEFQTMVESLGMMHKTLIGSVDAQIVASAEEAGRPVADFAVDSALNLSAHLLKAQNGAAIEQAKAIVDNVRATRGSNDQPSTIDVPAHVVKAISESILVTASLLTPVLSNAKFRAGPGTVVLEPAHWSDRGDLGFLSNWYNSGNISD